MTQEVDDLRQLRLRLIDSRDVRERDAVARRLVPARARKAERSESVLDIARTPQQPEQQEDEEDRRPEAEQQALPPRRPGIQWLGVDDHLLLLEQACQGVVIGERGNLGLEERRRLRPCVGHLLREGALDRRALRRDFLDVPHRHLLKEERAVGNADAGRRLRRARANVEVDGQKREEENDPGSTRAKAGPLRRRRSARSRRRARAPLPILASFGHRSGLRASTMFP
jgi:hypothetical protein